MLGKFTVVDGLAFPLWVFSVLGSLKPANVEQKAIHCCYTLGGWRCCGGEKHCALRGCCRMGGAPRVWKVERKGPVGV